MSQTRSILKGSVTTTSKVVVEEEGGNCREQTSSFSGSKNLMRAIQWLQSLLNVICLARHQQSISIVNQLPI